MRFRIRLKELRQQQDLTQDEIARRVGVHRSYISKLEHGRVSGRDLLFRLARNLGWRLDDLITFELDEAKRC